MKKILTVAALLTSLIVHAQGGPPTKDYLPVSTTGYNWWMGYFRSLNIPVGDSAQFTSARQWRGSGGIYYDTLDTPTSPKGLYIVEGGAWVLYSSGSGGGGGKFTEGSATIDIDSSGGKYVISADTAQVSTKWNVRYEAYKPINVAEYSTPLDNGQYSAFAWPVVRRDTLWAVIKNAPTHVLPGHITVMRSNNGMQSYDSVFTYRGINNSGVSNAIATCIDDTIWLAWQTTAQSYVKIARSTDGFRSLQVIDSFQTPGVGIVPFGNFIKLPSGYKYFNYYEFGSSYAVKWTRSATGVGWTTVSTLISGTPGAHEYNETWIEQIDGTTDGNTRLIAIMRDEALGVGPLQWTSTDGGATWTNQGRVAALANSQERYAAPASIMRIGDNLVIAKGMRVDRPPSGTEDDYHITVIQGQIDSVFADTSKWSAPNKLYNARANYSGQVNDFGYPNLFILGGQPRMIAYDVSNKNVGGGDINATRVFTMPVYTQTYMRWEATAVQSIPASTETNVTFGYKALDSDNIFNVDSGFVIIKKDGMYSIKAHLSWQPVTSGTYRAARIRVVNSAINNNESNKLVAVDVKQPSTNALFSDHNLFAEVFLREGEKVLVTVQHDHTSSVNLGTNTQYSPLQATLEIKQLR